MYKTFWILFLGVSFFSCKTVEKPTAISMETSKIFHEGLRAYLAGNFNESQLLLDKALIQSPELDAAAYLKAQMYLADGQLQESSKYLLLAAKSDPKNTYYTTEVAFMYGQMNEFEKAAKVFESLIKQFPLDGAHYFGAYQNYLQAKNYKNALKILALQSQKLGLSSEITFNQYKTYLAWGKKREAETILEKGLIQFPNEPLFLANMVDIYMLNNDFKRALPLLEKLCEEDPENGLAKMVLGEMYLSNGDTKKGEKFLTECVLLPGPSITQKSNILSQLQKIHGCTDQNRILTSSFISLNPNEVIGYALLGDLNTICKNNKEAIIAYKSALKLNPNAFPVWQQLTYLEYQEKLWLDLLFSSEKCLELFPSQPYPYLTKAIALNKSKNFESVESIILMGLELINQQSAIESELKFQLAVFKFYTHEEKKALQVFEESLSLQPNNFAIKADCANELIEKVGYIEIADSLISMCLINDPKNPKYIAIKGRVSFYKNNISQAIELLDNALLMGFDIAQIEEWLGDCYEKNGNHPRAVEYWQLSINHGNNSEGIKIKLKL